MDEFEKEEVKKSRPVVKNKLNEWHDWLVDHVPKPIKNAVSKKIRLKNSILGLYDGVKNALKGDDNIQNIQKTTLIQHLMKMKGFLMITTSGCR